MYAGIKESITIPFVDEANHRHIGIKKCIKT